MLIFCFNLLIIHQKGVLGGALGGLVGSFLDANFEKSLWGAQGGPMPSQGGLWEGSGALLGTMEGVVFGSRALTDTCGYLFNGQNL